MQLSQRFTMWMYRVMHLDANYMSSSAFVLYRVSVSLTVRYKGVLRVYVLRISIVAHLPCHLDYATLPNLVLHGFIRHRVVIEVD